MEMFQNVLIEYYAVCEEDGKISPQVFYHSIALWRHCLEMDFQIDFSLLLFACSKIAAAYHGFQDKALMRISGILHTNKHKLEEIAILIMQIMKGRIWIESPHYPKEDIWNHKREKKNIVNIIKHNIIF